MRNTLLTLLCILSVAGYAQWPKVFGQNSYDMTGREIKRSYDGGILFSGAERLSPGWPLSGYLYKTDINGNLLWKRYTKYTGNEYDVNILGLSQTPDGGLFLSGQFMKDYENSDGYYIRLNACGEKLWCGTVYIPGYTYCAQNFMLPDGSFIIHGEQTEFSWRRIWLYKISSSGEFLWGKSIQEADSSYFHATGWRMQQTADSNILISGFADSERDSLNPGWGWQTPFWVKFDYDGNELWDLPWLRETHDYGDASEAVQDINGHFICCGLLGPEGEFKASLFRITADGVKEAVHSFSGFGTASGLYTINYFQDSTLFLGGAYAIGQNGYTMVIKSDTAANIIKSKPVPSLYGMPVGYSAMTPDNKVLGMGERYSTAGDRWEVCLFRFNSELEYDSLYSIPLTYDSLCPNPVIPQLDFTLDCPMVSVPEPEEVKKNLSLKVYPNPADEWITVELPEYYLDESSTGYVKIATTYHRLPGKKSIEVLNLKGQIVYSEEFEDDRASITINSGSWPSGMYLIRLINQGKVRAQGKVIRR